MITKTETESNKSEQQCAYFGICPECGRDHERNEVLKFVGREGFFVCEEHKVTWWIGNVCEGAYDEEDYEAEWARNALLIDECRPCEPLQCDCDDCSQPVVYTTPEFDGIPF